MKGDISPAAEKKAAPNARLILGVLFAVSILNFVDRQILAILAGKVKADLLISDAQIGFLYGTVFGIFYAVFGVPLGVYADLGSRKKLIALGLGLWSLMTAASGLASGFVSLAIARIGVGVGEASASPAAYSLMSDLFPKSRRATAFAVYSFGVYVGIGLSSFIGGSVVDAWSAAYPSGQEPLGLRGWQVAFFVAGLPGLLLIPLVLAFREPERGAMEESTTAKAPVTTGDARAKSPVKAALFEAVALLPPFALFVLGRDGVPFWTNARTFAGIGFGAGILWWAFGDPVQWICVGLGLYVVATMAQRLRAREPDAFALIFKTPSLAFATLGFSALSFTGYAMSLWTAPFFIRYHGFTFAEIGGILGLISAVGGGSGVLLGGVLADRLRLKMASGRLVVGMMNALLPIPFLLLALNAADRTTALVLFTFAQLFAALWLPAAGSTVQDLVLPHMRARASAIFLLFVTIAGLALGPYIVGRLSDLWDSLRLAYMAATLSNVVALIFFLMAAKTISRDEETREARAIAARA